jgi:DGQHR domain-containing protein
MKADNYFQINVIGIKQIQTGLVLLGKLKFGELSEIHRLTERKESIYDPFGVNPIKVEKEDEEFQRQLNANKLKKISTYLRQNLELFKEGKSLGLFPTSIIVALDYDYDYEPDDLNDDFLDQAYSTELSNCFINKEGTKLFIPINKRVALIVDGQHRFYGVKELCDTLEDAKEKETINNFEFATTFLIGFDIYQLGQVFATVNFTQKPVNRSLYYDIFGSIPDTEKNDIKLAHDLALHLNNSEKSPIKGMIKMLGKGYGLFSQSFFVEKILIHFKSSGVWEKIYSDYIRGGDSYRKLPIFMRIYLNSIKEAYSSTWPNHVEKNGKHIYSSYNYNFVLCKTTGMGAFFRLIKDIYPRVEELSEEDMRSKILEIFNKISEEESKSLFSKEGDFGQGAGEGLQKKLYERLKSMLDLD